jgi:hypothetical protein
MAGKHTNGQSVTVILSLYQQSAHSIEFPVFEIKYLHVCQQQ